MKNFRILATLIVLLLTTLVACKKDQINANTDNTDNTELATTDDNLLDEETDISNEWEKEEESIELETRGFQPFKIDSIKPIIDSKASGSCNKYSGLTMLFLPSSSVADKGPTYLNISGIGFIQKNDGDSLNVKVSIKGVDIPNAFTVEGVANNNISGKLVIPGSDTLKNVTVKFTIGIKVKKTTGTGTNEVISFEYKTKSKSFKCVGTSKTGVCYGQSDWLIQNLTDSLPPSGNGVAIDTAAATLYIPQVGDVVGRVDGEWTGVVTAVSDAASTKFPNRKKYTVWEMNQVDCKGTIKKKAYYIAKGLASVPKTYETSAYKFYKR